MINTELHNRLIEKEIERKLIESNRLNKIVENRLLIEKLKAFMSYMVVLFLVLVMSIVLYRIFPSKSIYANMQTQKIQKIVKEQISKQECCNQASSESTPKKIAQINEVPKKKKKVKKITDGVDFVKGNGYVYKRVWKDGKVIKIKQLEKSIEESRKKMQEKIPKFAIPK